MAATAQYRICPDTGLKVYRSAEFLIKANAVAAVVFLLVGGVLGLLVALTRWPAVHLLPEEAFYGVLTGHGLNVLLFWIIFFEMAILYFASAVLLGSRLATPRLGWLAFILMLAGAVITDVSVLQGESSVMFTSYVPMQAAPHFYLGLVLFAVGALIGCFIFFGTLVIAREEKTYEGSVPLVTFGAITAAIIAVFTIASGAIILIPTFLWSVGLITEIDSLTYRLVWWGMGHSSQQINVAAQVAVWYLVAAVVLGAKPISEKVSRVAFLLYILFLQLASAHHLLADPGVSSSWKVFNTSYAMYLAVLGSLIHGMSVPGAVEAAQRAKGYTRGVFQWLRKAPWSNPAFAGMALSVIMFGFLGGISGVIVGTEQLNLTMHNTLYVPGHFHGTVVAGTTLAFMALTYIVLPLIFRREIIMPGLAKWQPYLFGIGVAGISVFMMGAGTLGVARRHWDILFSQAVLTYDYPPTAILMMGLNGIFGVLAAVGGALYIVIVVGTILFGKRREVRAPEPMPAPLAAALSPGGRAQPVPAPLRPQPAAVVGRYGSAGTWHLPGTYILVGIFFVAFVLYYFVNWKFLSEVWPLG